MINGPRFDLWMIKGRSRVWRQHWITVISRKRWPERLSEASLLLLDLRQLRCPQQTFELSGLRGIGGAVAPSPLQLRLQVLLGPPQSFQVCCVGGQLLLRAALQVPLHPARHCSFFQRLWKVLRDVRRLQISSCRSSRGISSPIWFSSALQFFSRRSSSSSSFFFMSSNSTCRSASPAATRSEALLKALPCTTLLWVASGSPGLSHLTGPEGPGRCPALPPGLPGLSAAQPEAPDWAAVRCLQRRSPRCWAVRTGSRISTRRPRRLSFWQSGQQLLQLFLFASIIKRPQSLFWLWKLFWSVKKTATLLLLSACSDLPGLSFKDFNVIILIPS